MHSTDSLNMNLLNKFQKEIKPSNVSLIYRVNDEFALDFLVDFDGEDTYLNICLLINDPEDGLLQHNVCEVGSEISFRMARSLSISIEKAGELYIMAESIAGEIQFWLDQNKIKPNTPLMKNCHLNSDLLSGIVRFGHKDYRNWSEAIRNISLH